MLKYKKNIIHIIKLIFVAFIVIGCLSTIPNQSSSINKKINPIWEQPILVQIDQRFSRDQSIIIKNALYAWENASNNKIKFIPEFNKKAPGLFKDFFNKSYNIPKIFIWYIDKNSEDIKDIDKYIYSEIKQWDGLWDYYGNIVIFKDHINLYNVTLHELGHALGLGHYDNNYKTTMHPNAIAGCITDIDSQQLCELYNCIPEPECVATIVHKHLASDHL